jgi:uncharacterized Fe-S radical SAM superfamily protein PflX
MFEPSYLKLYREGVLQERARQAVERLRECRLCPRECGVNRLEGEQGVCKTGRKATGGLARLGDCFLQRLQSPLHFLPEL